MKREMERDGTEMQRWRMMPRDGEKGGKMARWKERWGGRREMDNWREGDGEKDGGGEMERERKPETEASWPSAWRRGDRRAHSLVGAARVEHARLANAKNNSCSYIQGDVSSQIKSS